MISGIVVERRAGRTDDPHRIRILDHTSDGDPTRLPPRRPWIERMPADIASAWMRVAGQAIAKTCGLQDADHAAFTLDGWPAGYSAWVSRGKDNSQKQLDTYLYGARKKIRSQLELRQHFKNFCAALPCAIQNPQNVHNLQRAVSSSRPIPPPPRQIPSQLDPLQPISSQTNSLQLRPVNRPAAPAYNPARPHLIRPGELAPFQDGN
ncbi:hypothetical protein JCM8115_002008 [Rhodotorula mucilaginosa]